MESIGVQLFDQVRVNQTWIEIWVRTWVIYLYLMLKFDTLLVPKHSLLRITLAYCQDTTLCYFLQFKFKIDY